nr:unnamed protein product [Callosobruchus analis]
MSNIEIKHLFKYSRFPDGDVGRILFFLYIPLGIIILLLRIIVLFCAMLLSYVIPETVPFRKFINKITCMALGIAVTVENPKAKENVGVFVSNNLSVFDHVAVQNVTNAVMANENALEQIVKFNNFDFGSLSELGRFKENVQKFIVENKTPAFFAPEEKPTNGKCLLKFKTYPFQLSTKVQPICIQIERPFFNISVTVLGSSYTYDALFFMFSPITNYKIRFLDAVDRRCLSDEEFAEDVRQKIGACLKAELVSYTASDVTEWEKRTLVEMQSSLQHRRTASTTARRPVRTLNPRLQRMTMQIREVLPHVPYNVIYNDLCHTESVDNTITNILEGRIQFTPESIGASSDTISSSSTSKGHTVSPIDSQISSNTAAASFPKSAAERTRSFQERKMQLIANARRRYIEKHNLDLPL